MWIDNKVILDCRFRNLELGREYIVTELTVDKREVSNFRKRLKLIEINKYYLTFISKIGIREYFQNHNNIISLKEVKR